MTSEHKPHSRADAILTDLIATNAGGWETWARIFAGRVADLEEQLETAQREREDALRAGLVIREAHDELEEQLETLEWFLRHRTAEEGMTQWDVYEQIDWSAHPEFASNPATCPLCGFPESNDEGAGFCSHGFHAPDPAKSQEDQ